MGTLKTIYYKLEFTALSAIFRVKFGLCHLSVSVQHKPLEMDLCQEVWVAGQQNIYLPVMKSSLYF
jgi:hypothetical protein